MEDATPDDGGGRTATTWVAIACMFLALAVLAPALLTLPEWSGVGWCTGQCNGAWDAYGVIGIIIGAGCAAAAIAIFIGAIIATPPVPRPRRPVPVHRPPVAERATERAAHRPAPTVFDRWVRSGQ